MEQKIFIEQYDNGITLQSDGRAIVVLDHDKEKAIGKVIWDDIKDVMNAELCNEVEMSIEYKAVKE